MDGPLRPGEIACVKPEPAGAALIFIGRIRTPFHSREDCPRQGSAGGPICRIEIDEPWHQAMQGLGTHPRLEILYWMDKARRDLLVQAPRNGRGPAGTLPCTRPCVPAQSQHLWSPWLLSKTGLCWCGVSTVSMASAHSGDCITGIRFDIQKRRCYVRNQNTKATVIIRRSEWLLVWRVWGDFGRNGSEFFSPCDGSNWPS